MKELTLKEARKESQLTQAALGKELGLSRNTIVSLESGGSLPTRKSQSLFPYFKSKGINVKFNLTLERN